MKNYWELERELKNLEGIELPDGNYRIDNLITPNLVGYISIVKGIKAEISYGTWLNNCYIIGFTLFRNNKLLPYEERGIYNKPFNEDNISEIPEYVKMVKEMLEK